MPDVGGGFPVRYDTDPPPLARYAAAITEAAAGLPYPVTLACTRAGDRRPDRHHDCQLTGTAWRRGTQHLQRLPSPSHQDHQNRGGVLPLDEKAEFTITTASDGIPPGQRIEMR